MQEWLENQGFTMPHLDRFEVSRPGTKPDPYNPDRVIETGYQQIGEIRGYLASRKSSEMTDRVRDPGRTRTESVSQLVIPDPDADVRIRDRINDPTRNRIWLVTGFPAADRNPFTGWHPTLVAELEEVIG